MLRYTGFKLRPLTQPYGEYRLFVDEEGNPIRVYAPAWMTGSFTDVVSSIITLNLSLVECPIAVLMKDFVNHRNCRRVPSCDEFTDVIAYVPRANVRHVPLREMMKNPSQGQIVRHSPPAPVFISAWMAIEGTRLVMVFKPSSEHWVSARKSLSAPPPMITTLPEVRAYWHDPYAADKLCALPSQTRVYPINMSMFNPTSASEAAAAHVEMDRALEDAETRRVIESMGDIFDEDDSDDGTPLQVPDNIMDIIYDEQEPEPDYDALVDDLMEI